MTSKNLFFKLIKQDFQKRIWCPIVIFIGYFLALEVRMLIMFDSLAQRTDISIKEYVELRFFGTQVWGLSALACIVAFLCALSGFSYLHSKVQLDTYHSLPVNRVQLFASKYISGVMQFFFPFVFHIFVCMAISAGKGAFSSVAFVNALQSIGVSLLVFLLAYAVFIMAVCLTGNLIVSIVACGVLFAYSTLLSLLYYGLFERFFHTFLLVGWEGYPELFATFGFSPASMFTRLFVPSASDSYNPYFKWNAGYLWVIVVAVIVYTLFAFLLYWKRASEMAGKAIAFRWAEPIIKTLIVIPFAFYVGLFFAEISSEQTNNAWFLFGVVFGYIIIALLLEIIFRFNIKSAFSHKKQLLFNSACVAVLFVIFRYDVLGYDTYVPADKELISCAVSIDNLMPTSPLTKAERRFVVYRDVTEYRMENVAIQGNPSVMELARKAVEANYYQECMEWERTYEGDISTATEHQYRSITFGYNLKNGKSVYRRYLVDIADAQNKKLLADIFNDANYKTGTNVMLNSGWEEEYKLLYCSGDRCNAVLDMTPKFQSELLETYREEYLKLDFDTLLSTYPIGSITPQTVEEYEYTDNSNFYRNFRYNARYNGNLIYPQFTKTIALLKENGFDIYETFTSADVAHIAVTYIKGYEVHEATGNTYYTHDYIEVADVSDEEQKQQILDSMLNDSWDDQLRLYTDFYDNNFEITLYFDTKDNELGRYQFKKDMVPQFIYELEEYKEALTKPNTIVD